MKTTKLRLATKALSLIAGAFVASFMMAPMTSNAVIHEIVAAYCSGGGHGAINAAGVLFPPGLFGGSNADNFAQPIEATGAAVNLLITDHPAAKYPEGTSVFAANSSTADHPSAEHCANLP